MFPFACYSRAEYTEIAELIEPLRGGFEAIGGMDYLKNWARGEIIAPVRDGRLADAPKGVLLVGPPGTGKTWFVRGLAAELGFNAVALRAENILGGIVGESERKLSRFFAFCRALSPVLVFFDELDQSDMAQRGNTSGNPVASNLFSQMLQFMSDETLRGQVIVVFASNRPDLIDPALMRFGRMDAIIPVLLPDADERRAIIQAQAKAQGVGIGQAALALIAEQTEQYSAGDLGAVVAKARKLANRAGQASIGIEDATQALRWVRPATIRRATYYTLLAIQACNDGEHLPPAYADLLIDRATLNAQLQAAQRDTLPEQRSERDW